MGIHYYFRWMKQTFPDHIKSVCISQQGDIPKVDTFLIDMNGIIHTCCQKQYQYGSFKPQKSLLHPQRKPIVPPQEQVFAEIMNYVDNIVDFVKPKKRLVMAIDGPAPISKIYQQKSRRARSSLETCSFDTCSITPGTKFLTDLSLYIDSHIKRKVGTWNFEIIFSDDKVPGEGEHECVKYVRQYDDKDTYMIFGMDADLVMLSLGTHKQKFYILREDNFNKSSFCKDFFFIDMVKIRENLVNAMLGDFTTFSEKQHINDFILMIFLSGNDFLPNIPSIAIVEGSVETFFRIYTEIVRTYGPLTSIGGEINRENLTQFAKTLAMDEEKFLSEKNTPFPDTLLEKYKKGTVLDIKKYREEYYKLKLNCHSEDDIKNACLEYIEGLQWVLSYYLHGVPSWNWFFPYNYSPFISDIARYIPESTKKIYGPSVPLEPFMQLLCVLPKKSANLLPSPLNELIQPYEITIDLDGKHKEWEGVVLGLPAINIDTDFLKKYRSALKSVNAIDKKRNYLGKILLYK
jgi:5'-3' exonuclease